mmetsp:Transcript_67990/g.188304  ORF Transcript_67990/g.188304 Transcript_67990/m.188304 type:complete len:93 (+) Transcript_67990:392-670(+)
MCEMNGNFLAASNGETIFTARLKLPNFALPLDSGAVVSAKDGFGSYSPGPGNSLTSATASSMTLRCFGPKEGPDNVCEVVVEAGSETSAPMP